MKTFHPKNLILTALSALLLIFSFSCSGGSTVAGGGIDGTGIISTGSITSFGSIFVNGSEFDTSNALIIIDGEEIGIGDEVVQDNLDIGRVVNVNGSPGKDDESFIADRVIYSNNIVGPVESINNIDAKTKEIIVLGQTVILNVNTSFKGTGFETIAVEDVIEVSGFFDDMGTVWATFIGKTGELTPGLEVEVTGYVSNLDTDLMTFAINDLTVDYLFADTSGLPGGMLTEGMLVEVDGSLDETGAVLLAATIEPADDLDAENADQFEITGFVTEVVPSTEFVVGNQAVIIDPEAVFVDGTQDDIILGAKLEAEGSLFDGVLHAWEIEFWETDQVEVEDVVTDIVSPDEFTVGDQVIQTDEHTVFDGIAPEDIELGMLIEIKGVPTDIDYSIIIADKVSFEQE
jgi:hypothetical protein